MEQTKHTPGPWRADAEGRAYEIVGDIRSDCQGETVVFLATVHGNETSREVSEANARLIAAAPDLLDVLKQAKEMIVHLMKVCDLGKTFGLDIAGLNSVLCEIPRIVAKAEGK